MSAREGGKEMNDEIVVVSPMFRTCAVYSISTVFMVRDTCLFSVIFGSAIPLAPLISRVYRQTLSRGYLPCATNAYRRVIDQRQD